MKKKLLILSLMLFILCTLQAQRSVVTWKVNGIEMTTSNVKDGNKPSKANIPDNPNINCEKEFVGWTVEESYNNNLKPSDLFNDSDLFDKRPTITTSVTFHAVFVGEDSVYTTENCYEDLQFIPNDTVVSLKEAQQGRILFIRNKDARIEHIYGGDGNFDISYLNFTDSGTYLTLDFPGEYWVKVTTKPDWRYREYDKHLVQFEIRDDSRTIKYYGFDDNWCIDAISQGGIKNVGDTFIISTQVPSDPDDLGRQFINWNTSDLRELGKSYSMGDTILVKEDITLYPQWVWEITTDLIAPEFDIPNTDIIIKAGNTFSICDGEWYEAHILTLEGGLNSANPPYAMPSLYIEEGGEFYKYNPDNIVHFDLSINNHYYPFAVPFPVLVSDIDYADPALAAASTYGIHYLIKRYDGALRAKNGANRDQNWVQVNESETLQPGVGYIIIAMPVDGNAVIRIPLEFSDDWTIDGEQSDIDEGLNREEISISAHSGAAATADPIHAGWNFIANPYLAKYDGSKITNAPAYASIPCYDFSAYDQVLLKNATLSPEYPFFVQVKSDATLNFATTGRRQAPAAVRANSSNQTVSATFHLVQTDNQTLDHTSIILNEQHTPAYEINADLEKMFGSAYTTSLYSISQDYRLAFNALSFTDAQSPIPFGFRAAEAGNYTIVLTNPEDMAGMESVLLYDNHTHQTTNLLYFDYTFHTERTQDDTRFTIQFISRNNTTTNIEDLHIYPTSTTKFIHNNQLYITREGKIYNTAGIQIK